MCLFITLCTDAVLNHLFFYICMSIYTERDDAPALVPNFWWETEWKKNRATAEGIPNSPNQ